MQSQPGRNDPCPCGSGKKYKKCCMNSSDEKTPECDVREELKEALQERVFDSLEEANLFAKEFMEKRNNRSFDSFHGLSPKEMHQLLHSPFDSPEMVQFNFGAVTKPEDAPMLQLLSLIAEAVGEEGLKPTVTGNLPRAVSRQIAKKYLSEEKYNYLTRTGEFMSENDIPDLSTARLIAESAGFIRKYQGRFTITKKCRQLIQSSAWAEIYEQLFITLVTKFNWAYDSNGFEIPFFQYSFAFTLYLLYKYGNEPRSSVFYENCFVNAFPMLSTEFPDNERIKGKEFLKIIYSAQVLYLFGGISGLVQYQHSSLVQVTPLLYDLVRFNH